VPEAILDNSAYARVARYPAVRNAVLDYLNGPLNTLRSVLVQRLEICTSVRNVAEFDAEMQALAAMPLLDDALPAVGAAAESLQRALVQRGTHRGPKVVDLLIAATAIVHDAEVLHYDADFDLLAAAEPSLQTRWIVPRGSVA
jgi:predicted nucleic acid-binding protein